jgi:outer membrane protein
MKKFTSIVLFLLTLQAFTQQSDQSGKFINAGVWNTTLAINIFSDTDKQPALTSKNNHYGAQLSTGYFVSKNTEVGLGIGYNYQKSEYTGLNAQGRKKSSYTINTYLKKYIFILPKFAFSAQGSFVYTYGDERITPSNTNIKAHTIQLRITPGINYFINDNLALQAEFGSIAYSHTSNTYTASNAKGSRDNFVFNLNMSNFYWGITYYW